MLIQLLLLIAGLIVLVKGADWLVDGGSGLAKKLNISDLAIGLTIVAFGTSAPELVVNTIASYEDHNDIVLGNIIGSNLFNLMAILGICGLIIPLAVQKTTVWKEIPFSFVAIIFLFFLANDFGSDDGVISAVDGIILLSLFLLFIFYVYKQLKTEVTEIDEHAKHYSNLKIWILILIGLGGLILGGKLVVDNAVAIATELGISEKVIGLTIIAAGTSLPELATSMVAAFKKKADIAVGNIIGSNIFNIFLILGVSSLVSPVTYNTSFNSDIYFLAAGTLFLFLAMFTGKKKKLDRWEASILLIAFCTYTAYLVQKAL